MTSMRAASLLVAAATLSLGCGGGSSNLTAPDTSHGSIVINTATTGGIPVDPSNYDLSVDGKVSTTLKQNGPGRVDGLAPGTHTLELGRISVNCAVSGQNPSDVNVTGGGTATVSITVACTQAPRAGRGHEIAYATARDGENEIYVVNDDGLGLVRLTHNDQGDNHPDWSPDGSRIAWFSRQGEPGEPGDAAIYTMDPEGSNVTRITSLSAFARWPKWRPDGNALLTYLIPSVFTHPGEDGIYLINPDGSQPHRLTYGYETSWAPDGSRFAVSDDTSFAIVNADGSGRTSFSGIPKRTGRPAWSPDGTKILFSGWDGAGYQVYVMTADGTGASALTSDPAPQADRAPAWSPDGTRIAYMTADPATAANGNGGKDVWIMNVDGSGARKLTYGGGANPAWRP